MLLKLPQLQPDHLWELIKTFDADPRAEKMDLIVGMYRDELGQTPVMQVVRDAEIELAEQAESKAYKSLSGNVDFNNAMAAFLLGDQSEHLRRQCTIQAVGGTGALRLLAGFIQLSSPDSTVWNTNPAYMNHQPLMQAAGLRVEPFRWQESREQLAIDLVFEDLAAATQGDIVLLHGCCHNPTGIDPTPAQWQQVAEFCHERQLIPLIDMAYQGFADGVQEDATGLRVLADQLETVLVAASCSKNMGLYCERTGVAMVLSRENPAELLNIRSNLERLARSNYSMPPEHGAAIANQLFARPKAWFAELEQCRERVCSLRRELGIALKGLNAPAPLQSISRQKGMFSLLPFSVEQMTTLREDFGVYGTPSGRINMAGLLHSQVPALALALSQVGSQTVE